MVLMVLLKWHNANDELVFFKYAIMQHLSYLLSRCLFYNIHTMMVNIATYQVLYMYTMLFHFQYT